MDRLIFEVLESRKVRSGWPLSKKDMPCGPYCMLQEEIISILLFFFLEKVISRSNCKKKYENENIWII